MTNIQKM